MAHASPAATRMLCACAEVTWQRLSQVRSAERTGASWLDSAGKATSSGAGCR
ncbi:hypothetical protein [Nonomuraea salmonea]|uniref:hypothetical protein n=1 Tax=Nonomuraea salmonea TaxID=46181 RepID=UPI0031F14EB5